MVFGLAGKIIGGIVFVIGLLISILLPYVTQHTLQPIGMSKGGVLFGIVIMGIGLYLILG